MFKCLPNVLGFQKMATEMQRILVMVMSWSDILLNNSLYKCTAQAECHCETIYNLEVSVKMILCPDMALSRQGTAVCPKGKQNYWCRSRAKVLNRQYFLQNFMITWWLIDYNLVKLGYLSNITMNAIQAIKIFPLSR